MENIDFVMIWVDGGDPEWRKEFNRYSGKSTDDEDKRDERYRDWDNLRYWFRGVEKFAPWVNRIHFVTCGHVPQWLNLSHPKLHFVRHSDYIPAEWLPTFSSHPIELNLHRIEGLSDRFVYFNDDCFLLKEVAPERFFRNGLPCERVGCSTNFTSEFFHANHILQNNAACINAHFDKKKVIAENFCKWFSPKCLSHPSAMLQTLRCLSDKQFSRFNEPHLPNAFLKSTLEEVWDQCGDTLRETSACRFRNISNVNQWLFRDWQIVKGIFTPYDVYRDSICLEISDRCLPKIEQVIRRQKKRILVLNDSSHLTSQAQAQETINRALGSILPDKSQFEL